MAHIELKNKVFCGRGFSDQIKPKRIYCQRNAVVLGPSRGWRILLGERILRGEPSTVEESRTME
jgi:hypothetical protein